MTICSLDVLLFLSGLPPAPPGKHEVCLQYPPNKIQLYPPTILNYRKTFCSGEYIFHFPFCTWLYDNFNKQKAHGFYFLNTASMFAEGYWRPGDTKWPSGAWATHTAVATGRRLEGVLSLALLIKDHSALLLGTLAAMLDLLLTGVTKSEMVYSSCL